MTKYITQEVNTQLARDLQRVVTAGWANQSDGNVEAPTGHFAKIIIEPNELNELVNAVFDGEDCLLGAGYYLLTEDSDGNALVEQFAERTPLHAEYNRLVSDYAHWDGE